MLFNAKKRLIEKEYRRFLLVKWMFNSINVKMNHI